MASDRNTMATNEESTPGLAIYGYPQCPFCRRVLDAANALGLEIPLRNTLQDDDHRRELEKALGQTTVPVLRIESVGGDLNWLRESDDIIRYLSKRFGAKR